MNKSKKILLENIENMSETEHKMLQRYINKYIKIKDEEAIIDRSNVDKTSEKYKILLKYINSILKNMNKDIIDDLTKFKNIDRLDIIKKENEDLLLNEMEVEISKHFDRKKYEHYKKTRNVVLNCIRWMCKDVGLLLINKKKDITEGINGKRYKYTHLFYSIK